MYTVEILEWLDPRAEHLGVESYPYSGFAPGAVGCADDLGDSLGAGEELVFEAVRTVRDEGASCRPVEADVSVPGQVLSEGNILSALAGMFVRMARVELDNGCRGEYAIGLTRVLDGFGEPRPDVAISDYMLVRKFLPLSDTACSARGLEPDRRCVDSWFVRIRDESGDLISQDSPWR